MFVQTVPACTSSLTRATKVTTPDCPVPMLGNVIVRFDPEPPHTPLSVAEHETNDTWLGRLSVTTRFETGSPGLLTVMV